MTVGHRGPASPGFPRRSFGPGAVPRRSSGPGLVGPRGGVSAHGGIGRPVVTRGGSGHGFRAPQAVVNRGAPGRPASFAGGGRPGGGFGRGSAPSAGGGPRVVGRSGGRAGR
jgi:translation initiation factor IF-2